MMPRIKLSEFLDKLVLLCAMLLFAWVGVSAIFQVRKLERISGQGRPLLSELKVNAPLYEATPPEEPSQAWELPRSQSRGEEWIFDVFTPPVIYYDPNSREFAVTPPTLQTDDGADQWEAFDVELIEVRLRPYRLQLVGYAGDKGSYVAYFEDVATRELISLRSGEEQRELGVRLIDFEEKQIKVEAADSMPVFEDIGVARLLDFNSGQEVGLTNMETKMFSDLEAEVLVLPSGAIQTVKVGSRIELESGDYIIGDLSVKPEEAIITKVAKDQSRRYTKSLLPTSSKEAQPRGSLNTAPDSPFSIRPRRNRDLP